MGLKKNQSAITHIEVAFREIDRFFDVHGFMNPPLSMRIPAMDKNREPRIVIRDPWGILARRPGALSDENGEPIYDQMFELPGVYRTLRTQGEAAFLRTFARWKSQPVDNKYVYVWAADDKYGEGMRLVRELFFRGGKFQLIDFNSKTRRPKGQSRERLVLDLLSFQDAQPKQLYYFFLLARYQVPRKRLDDLMKDLPARGMRLWDEFYTDYCPQDDLTKAVAVDAPPRAGESLPPKLTFLIHLVDPFREALYRSERYKNALHRWQETEQELSQDAEYTLAKGIEFLRGTSAGQACPDSLANSFSDYMFQREKEAKRRLFVTYNLADDLVQWIGRSEIREKLSINGVQSDTWFGNSSKRIPSKEEKGPDQWHSHYCQALLDYATPAGDLTADKAVAHKIGRVICAAVDELDQSTYGEQWLKDVFEKGIDGKLDKVATGGFEFFFQSSLAKSKEGGEGGSDAEAQDGDGGKKKESAESGEGGEGGISPDVARKGDEVVKGVVTGLLKTLGKHWVEHYREHALSSLQNWYKAKHGITLASREAGMSPKVRESIQRKFKNARRRGIKKLEVKPGAVELWEFGATQFKFLQFGLEVINLCYAVDEARDGDKWTRLEALGSAMDASKAMFEAFHNEEYVSEVEEAGSVASKAFRVVGFASAAIDMITGMHGIYESQSVGEQVSEGMKTLGAGLVFGGQFAEEHPAGMIAMVVGAGLQGLGSYWKGQASPICEFTRNCRWGAGPSAADSIGSVIKDENSYWYRGKLSALKGDIPEQLRCLDRFKYHYEPEIEFDSTESSCTLKIRMKGASQSLGPAAVWNVRVELKKTAGENGPDAGMRTVTLQPDSGFDDLDWTAEEWVTFQALTPDEIVTPQGVRHTWWMQANVLAKVDAAGDSVHLVEGEANMSYSYIASTPTPQPEFENGTPGPGAEVPDAGTPVGATGSADLE